MMKTLFAFIFIFISSLNLISTAQPNFKKELKKADPVKSNPAISVEERIKIHQAYLSKAISTQNLVAQFYSQFYLYFDNYRAQNYVEASKHLLIADSIARVTNNLSWLGAVFLRKGELSDVVDNSYSEAIANYKSALKCCTEAHDSLCIGESLEQMSSMYGFIGEAESNSKYYDTAHVYINKAFPFLIKFADRSQMAATYNNYSNLLAFEKRYAEAEQYIDSAIFIARQNKNIYKELRYLNNKACLYADLGEYSKAIDTLLMSMVLNRQNQFADLLLNDYNSLAEIFEKKGDYRSSSAYYKKFHALKDSLSGEEVQMKIAELKTKFETKEKELALNKSRLQLSQAEQKLEKGIFLIIVIILVALVLLIILGLKIKKNREEKEMNQLNLKELTSVLLQKNTLLTELQQQLSTHPVFAETSAGISDLESNLYNQRILTDADWHAFKSRFDKAYPGYLVRLRTMYDTISEAEERLFIFIKLNLKSKEIAAIVGISTESVKKTRTRLRKRLELSEEIDLEEYILAF
ncbi:MAG: hypothetical protein ABI723_23380 [Bacteroidia bacterium]